LYRPGYIRKYTSMTIASSKVGKSLKLITEALAMVSHKALLKIMPSAALRVWYWNGEDPKDEIDKRIAAAIKHYKLTEANIGDRLFIDSGRDMPIVLAQIGVQHGGTIIAKPVVDGVVAALRDNKIDVMIIDPFISSHRVSENDNNAIDMVAKKWSHIAEVTNCAIRYGHHSRKMYGEAVTRDSQRGASSNYAAVRFAETLNYMTEREAKEAGINPERRKFYVRQDSEDNLAPPSETAVWFEKLSVDLCNAPTPEESDKVGVVVPWNYPKSGGVRTTPDDHERIIDALMVRDYWRENAQSEDWVGKPIAQVVGIDVGTKLGRERVTKIVDDLVNQGKLHRGARNIKSKVVPVVSAQPTFATFFDEKREKPP